MGFFLGVHGGDVETVAALANADGQVVAAARAGGANYQLIGETAAGRELRAAVEGVLRAGNVGLESVDAAAFGMAGADRDNERLVVERMIDAHAPVPRRFTENEALLALRAATRDAVGVALVAGVGTNCVGRDRYGRRHQIGGLGAISGDVGYAEDLARRAIGGAWMAFDGRAAPSLLSTSVPESLGVASVEDVPSILVRGEFPEPMVVRAVTALFAAAKSGDGLALRILEDTGSRLGAAAAAAMRALVLRGANAVVVLGGTILTEPSHALLVEAIERRIRQTVSEAHVMPLLVEPVVGALLFARDLVGPAPFDFAQRVRAESARIDALCRVRF